MRWLVYALLMAARRWLAARVDITIKPVGEGAPSAQNYLCLRKAARFRSSMADTTTEMGDVPVLIRPPRREMLLFRGSVRNPELGSVG